MEQLEMLRADLSQCDEILLSTLLMRNRIVEQIMAYKEANHLPILQPEQEEKTKKWLEKSLADKRHSQEVMDVFNTVITCSKKIQARKLFDYNIVLIGFMGAGKSTISSYLSTLFAMDVVDMDEVIAQREGMSISDIFETRGEQYFRDALLDQKIGHVLHILLRWFFRFLRFRQSRKRLQRLNPFGG